VTECPNCRSFGALLVDRADGVTSHVPCWACPAGKNAMGIGPAYHGAALADNAEFGPTLGRWDGTPPGWILYGKHGRGKTHLAAAICRDQAAKGRAPRFVSAARLLRLIKATFDRDTRPAAMAALEALEEADVVVIDDLGAEHRTDFSEAELTMLLDALTERGAAVVVTSNLDYETLASQLGMRIASRVAGLARPLQITGPDRRMTRSA